MPGTRVFWYLPNYLQAFSLKIFNFLKIRSDDADMLARKYQYLLAVLPIPASLFYTYESRNKKRLPPTEDQKMGYRFFLTYK